MNSRLSYLRTLWRTRRGQRDLPRFMTYIVTYTCNARCIMCDSWKKPSPNDLTLEEIAKIYDQLPPMDAVRLSGGEPFVRRDLLDIAHLTQEKLEPLFLHVTSNGFLTDRIVDFCERRRRDVPLHLLISVDGMQNKHNQVRGHDKAWDYVMRTLAVLAPRREELRLQLAVNQTIVDAEGVEHYARLREHLAPLDIRNNMVMAYDASATYHLKSEIEVAPESIGQFTTFGDFGKEQLERLFQLVEEDLPRYPLAERMAKRYYLKGIRNRLLGDVGHPNPPCVALNSHLRLLPDGRVPICQFNTRPVGNLRHQSFEEVWYGDDGTAGRNWVKACPGCWAECEVLPSAVYSGDLLWQSVGGGKKPTSSALPTKASLPTSAPPRERLPIL